MNEDLVSIIIPVFKVDKTLYRCVESVYNQTYSDIEVILVDDGSPDICPTMCDEIAVKNKNAIVVHKSNGGPSSARNIGLKTANGQFFSFIDSDDFVTDDYVEVLYTQLKETNSDLTVSGWYRYGRNKKEKHYKSDRSIDLNCLNQNDLNVMLSEIMFISCAKLYKKNLLKELMFDEDVGFGEDTLFVFTYLLNSNRIKVCSKCLYYYDFSLSVYTKSFHFDLFHYEEKIFTAICNFIKALNIDSETKTKVIFDEALLFLRMVCDHYFGKGLESKKINKIEIIDIYKKVFEFYLPFLIKDDLLKNNADNFFEYMVIRMGKPRGYLNYQIIRKKFDRIVRLKERGFKIRRFCK